MARPAKPINVTTVFPIRFDSEAMFDVRGEEKNLHIKVGNPLMGKVYTFKVEPLENSKGTKTSFCAYASFTNKKDLIQAEKAVHDAYSVGCYRTGE